MRRCDRSAGNYRVTFLALHHKEPYHVQIQGHRDVVADLDGEAVLLEAAPMVGNDKAFEGELCEHEVQWLTEGVPGKAYPLNWAFTAEKLDRAQK